MFKPSLAALSLGFLLSGCSDRTPQPLTRPTVSQPAAVSPAVTSASATEASALEFAYTYLPSGKRDPFRSPADLVPPPPPQSCDQPLCRYGLDELKLAGVISGTSNPVAVIESPKGKGYQVYRGSKLGRNGGVVKQVLRDAIVVAEVTHDGRGLPREHETVLRLQPDLPVTMDE